jgi:hypothetical protein
LLSTLGQLFDSDNTRVRAIVQYFLDMMRWFKIATECLADDGHLIIVIGDSTVQGRSVKTSRLLTTLAPPELRLKTEFSYVLRNRSMQYSRWNHANVATENVLVFARTKKDARNQPDRSD